MGPQSLSALFCAVQPNKNLISHLLFLMLLCGPLYELAELHYQGFTTRKN